ncbi:polysaccharide deacetylase family protein [Vibrio sp. SM6]|uniref:Polysaccharide deacetylase family protein n=1 Tax=Vibrio agarilyticus TaxID=2726741 RepID=A0A7X8TPI8_9VIBR|nr:polysaccharide deacetylase family protein [Vibrio agarilyticus]NLS12513.1 polysaccharide deacetylase family protein [Vibrio agarilyticus]
MKIALTFDNSITPMTLELLQLLKQHDAKATFFCPARRAENARNVIQKIVSGGHVVAGNHYDYLDSMEMEFGDFIHQVIKSNRILSELTGQALNYYRPPFGQLTTEQRAFVNDSGLIPVYCNLTAQDDACYGHKVEQIVGNIMTNVRNHSIVLCHEVLGGEQSNILRALRIVIPMLKQCGYQFVTIDKIRLEAANQSQSGFGEFARV